jgi:predicted MFS family arabinose efflux permease
VIGALVCSRLSERRGRRMTLLIVAEVFVVGASCPPGQFRPADFARGQ